MQLKGTSCSRSCVCLLDDTLQSSRTTSILLVENRPKEFSPGRAYTSVLEQGIYSTRSSFTFHHEEHDRLDMTKRAEDELLDILIDDEPSPECGAKRSSPSTSKKPTHKRAKPHLKCVVCGDSAEGKGTNEGVSNTIDAISGYNFDAVSCESCKAFFRRNALRPPVRIRNIGESTASGKSLSGETQMSW